MVISLGFRCLSGMFRITAVFGISDEFRGDIMGIF
jgi:hypothetical protein